MLKKFGYPPDLQEEAVKLVLEQAETLSEDWAVWGVLHSYDLFGRS